MTDHRPDRKIQMDLVIATAQRMAKRMNAQFVVDQDKAESFLTYKDEGSHEDDSSRLRMSEGYEQAKIFL